MKKPPGAGIPTYSVPGHGDPSLRTEALTPDGMEIIGSSACRTKVLLFALADWTAVSIHQRGKQMPQIDTEGRHPEIQSLARYFDYDHLESPLREFSQQCYDLAANMIDDLPDSPELTVGLRKLLEAKDCFVRASMDLLMQQRIQESAELHEKRKESIVRDSERFGKVDEDHPYGYDR